jgi:uncharacterized protein DUF2783
MPLDTSPRLADPDALFAALVAAHEGLDASVSRQLDAAIVLLLANHIGETEIVLEAIQRARALVPAHVFGRHDHAAAAPHPGDTP